MTTKETTEKELLELLNNPRTGLRDSSDTNKTRCSILALFEQNLEAYKEGLREKILSQRPKTDDGMVSTIYATGWADREDEIFALINKETEI